MQKRKFVKKEKNYKKIRRTFGEKVRLMKSFMFSLLYSCCERRGLSFIFGKDIALYLWAGSCLFLAFQSHTYKGHKTFLFDKRRDIRCLQNLWNICKIRVMDNIRGASKPISPKPMLACRSFAAPANILLSLIWKTAI